MVFAAEVALFAVGVNTGVIRGIGCGDRREGSVVIDLQHRRGVVHVADPVDEQTVHVAHDRRSGEGNDLVLGGPGAFDVNLLAHAVGLVEAIAAVGVQRQDKLAHAVAELGRLAVGVAAGERGIKALALIAADGLGGLFELGLAYVGEGGRSLGLLAVVEVGDILGVDVAGEGVGDRVDVSMAERVVDNGLDMLIVVRLVGLGGLDQIEQLVVADEVQRPLVAAVLADIGLAEGQAERADQGRAAHLKDHQIEVGGIGGLHRPDAVVDARHMAGDADGEELRHDGLRGVLFDLAGLADDVQILSGVAGLGQVLLRQLDVRNVGIVLFILPFDVEVVEALVAERLHRDVAGAHKLGDHVVVQAVEDRQTEILVVCEDAGRIHVGLKEEVAAGHMAVVHDVLVGVLLFELVDGSLLSDVVAEVDRALLERDLGGGGLGDDLIGQHLNAGIVQIQTAGDVLAGVGSPVLRVGPERQVVAGHKVDDQVVAGADGLGGEVVAGVLRIKDVGSAKRELVVVRGLGRLVPVNAEGVGVNGFPALDVLVLQRLARADQPVEGGDAVFRGDGVALRVGDGLKEEDVPVGAVRCGLVAFGQVGVQVLVLIEIKEAFVDVPIELILRSTRAGCRLEVLDVHAGGDGQVSVKAADFAVLCGILVIVVRGSCGRSAAAGAQAERHDDGEDQGYCLFHFLHPFSNMFMVFTQKDGNTGSLPIAILVFCPNTSNPLFRVIYTKTESNVHALRCYTVSENKCTFGKAIAPDIFE